MTDDHGPGDFGVYDNLDNLGEVSKINTPNIDLLAQSGMRFNNAHSGTALCAPTRATIMSGSPTWQTNIRWGFGTSSLKDGQLSVGDLMQEANYRTALLGKGHLGGDIFEVNSDNAVSSKEFNNLNQMDFDRPLKDGMREHGYDYTLYLLRGIQHGPYLFWENDLATSVDEFGNSQRVTNQNKSQLIRQWEVEDGDITEIDVAFWGATSWRTRDIPQAMLNKSIQFMDSVIEETPEQPFFLHYNSVSGHTPYVPADFVSVDVNGDGNSFGQDEFFFIDGYKGNGPVADDSGSDSMRMVSMADAEVGIILSYLRQKDDPRSPGNKLIDNTLIIFTSDNGGIGPRVPFERDEWDVYDHDSTSGLRGNKAFSTEGGHRVPFIVQWPGQVPEGSVREQQVSNVDLMATLAGLTGQSLIDQGMGSFNLLPVFLGQRDDSDSVHNNLIVEDMGGSADGKIARKIYYEDFWKIMVGPNNLFNPVVYDLYNLDEDPSESNNLINNAAFQDRLSSMKQNYLVERNAKRMAPVFIGRNDTAVITQLAEYDDIEIDGELTGEGSINGNLSMNMGAALIPSGEIKISKDFVIRSNARIELDLSSTSFDKVTVDQSLFLKGGILKLELVNGFIPSLGDSFDIFSASSIEGTFDSLELPNLLGERVWDTSLLYSRGIIRVSCSGCTPEPTPVPTATAIPVPTSTSEPTPSPAPTGATGGGDTGFTYIVHKPTRAKIQSCDTQNGSPAISVDNSITNECVHWKQIPTGSFFHLENRVSGKLLKPDTNENGSDISIQPNGWRGNWTQWRYIERGDGFGHLGNRATGKYIYLSGNVGSKILQQPSTWRGDFTRWQFVPVRN